MIRREIELGEGERLWLLISQVEHARISGELTRQLAQTLSVLPEQPPLLYCPDEQVAQALHAPPLTKKFMLQLVHV